MLAFGSWASSWSQKVVQRVSAETQRDRIQQMVGALQGHTMLAQRGMVLKGWAASAPETLLGRATAWHSSQYNADTEALYRVVQTPRHVASRNR